MINIENIRKNSVGNQYKDKEEKKQKGISRKLLSAMLALLIVVGSFAACSMVNSVNYGYLEIYLGTEYDGRIYEYLQKYGVGYPAEVSDYQKIEELSETDVIIFYHTVGYDECEKVIQALGYEGWNDFLIKNNYVTKEGEPDFGMWQNSEELRITKLMEERYASIR